MSQITDTSPPTQHQSGGGEDTQQQPGPRTQWLPNPNTGDLEPFVDGKPVAWAPMPGSQVAYLSCPVFEVLYHGTRGPGKRLANSTKVLTNRGWVAAGDVNFSHKLVALDGSYTDIVGIHPCADRELYRVTFIDGAEILADPEHRWLVLSQKNGCREGWKVRTTEEIRKFANRRSVPFLQGPVPGLPWHGPDPYMIGLLLGDGTMRSRQVTLYSADDEILEHATSLGWMRYKYDGQCGRATCPAKDCETWRSVLPRHLSGDKHVPTDLMVAEPAARLAVLQGLMDSDGSAEKAGKQRFVSKSERLARDVADLCWSLGGTASVYRENRPSPKGGVDWRWRVNLRHNNKFNPFRLKRKAERMVEQAKFLTRGIRSIEPAGRGDGVCFSVSHESHCFVVEGYVVTHNSITALMDFAQHVGRGHGSYWAGIVFRRTYPELEDIVNQAKQWFPRIWPNSEFHETKHQWEWSTGEYLMFRHAERSADYFKYHGSNRPFVLWEELTTWPSLDLYFTMMSICRSPIKALPRKYRATTNPYGPNHNNVKKRFQLGTTPEQRKLAVKPKPPMVGPIIRDHTKDGVNERVAIRGHISENKILLHSDPGYVARLTQAAPNPAALLAWLEGDWDVVAGGLLDDVWVPSVHVIPDIPGECIPKSWRIARAYDHGQSRPFAVQWWACSDGTPASFTAPTLTENGVEYLVQTVGAVAGDEILLNEWYGARKDEKGLTMPNAGLNLDAGTEIAPGIKDREERYFARYGLHVHAGPADSAIFDDSSPGKSVAADMRRPPGRITWTRADKRPGSRIQGVQQIRRLLKGSLNIRQSDEAAKDIVVLGPRATPGMFICQNNVEWLRTVPVLPRDPKQPDDADTNAEDHAFDCARYYCRRASTVIRQEKF